jgi:hypothetical protein
MSANAYSRSRRPRNPATEKPGCAHCRNLGLPFDHWLRASIDPDSPVTCPVLLATECRNCRQLGHTASRCPSRSLARVNTCRDACRPTYYCHSTPDEPVPETTSTRIMFGGRSWVDIHYEAEEAEEAAAAAAGACI